MTNDTQNDDFLDRLRDAYAPPEMGPNRAAAFDEALRERLERPRLRWPAFAVGGLAVAAAAAVLVWTLVAPPPTAVGLDSTPPVVAAAPTAAQEADELLALLEVEEPEDLALPDDYEALADVLEL